MKACRQAVVALVLCSTLLGSEENTLRAPDGRSTDSLRLHTTYAFVRAWNLAASFYSISPDRLDDLYDFAEYSCAYRLSFIIIKCLKSGEEELAPLEQALDAALAEATPDLEVNRLASWCLQELQGAEAHRVKLLRAFEKLYAEESAYNANKDPYEVGYTMVGSIEYSLKEIAILADLVVKAKALVAASAAAEDAIFSPQQSLRLRFAECYAAGYALANAVSNIQYAAEIILGNAEEFCVYTEISLARDLLAQAALELGNCNKFMSNAEPLLIQDSAALDLATANLNNLEVAAQRRAALLQSWNAMHEAAEHHHTKSMFSVVLKDLKEACDIGAAHKKSQSLVRSLKEL